MVELLHSDTSYPAGSRILEAGCGVGAQTITVAKNSPGASITSVDISGVSIAEAERRLVGTGLSNVQFKQADIFNFDRGIRDLYRTTEADGVFCYTFFKAVGNK